MLFDPCPGCGCETEPGGLVCGTCTLPARDLTLTIESGPPIILRPVIHPVLGHVSNYRSDCLDGRLYSAVCTANSLRWGVTAFLGDGPGGVTPDCSGEPSAGVGSGAPWTFTCSPLYAFGVTSFGQVWTITE